MSSEDEVDPEGGEGAYVRYEMALRRLESEATTLIGVSGSVLRDPPRAGLPLADGSGERLPRRARGRATRSARGRRAGGARALRNRTRETGAEWQRKVRTVSRGIAVLLAHRELLHPRFGRAAFSVWGHKLARFTSPFALLLPAGGEPRAGGAVRRSGAGCSAAQLLAYAAALLALVYPAAGAPAPRRGSPDSSCSSMPPPCVAWLRHLRGERTRGVAADRAMSGRAWRQLAPAGDPIDARERRAARRLVDPGQALRDGLRACLGAEEIQLYASGRAALRALLAGLANRSGRSEVVIPAYCCFSVPAAAVSAGLRVRLVDVDARGRIDAQALARLPLDGVAAIVVANLFGIPENVAPLRDLVARAGVALVDDAAQALGGEAPDGRAGARGDVGLLSFGRGKPLSGLGGGALVWPHRPIACSAPETPPPAHLAAQLRALAYAAALHPSVFRWLAALPGLHIGETLFEPDFVRGPIDGASLVLAAARLPHVATLGAQRAERAEALAAALRRRTRFVPLTAPAGTRAVHPRLAVLAPDAATRADALARLARAGLGASAFYPSALGEIRALQPHLCGPAQQPGAADFAARVFTLPTHAGAGEPVREKIAELLTGS